MSQETGRRRAQHQAGVLTPSRERGEANVRYKSRDSALSQSERFSLTAMLVKPTFLLTTIFAFTPGSMFRIGVFVFYLVFRPRPGRKELG